MEAREIEQAGEELEKIREQFAKLSENIDNTMFVLRSTVVSRILNGGMEDCEVTRRMCNVHGMEMKGNAFCAVCFDIAREDKDEYTAEELVKQEYQISLLAKTMREPALGGEYEVYEGFYPNTVPVLVCLTVPESCINGSTEEIEEEKRLFERIRECLYNLEREKGVRVCASAGGIYRDFNAISRSFREASMAQEFRTIMSIEERLICYRDYMYEPPESGVILDSNMEKQLFSAIRARHYEFAKSMMHDQINAMFYTQMPPIVLASLRFSAAKSLMISIIMDIMTAAEGAALDDRTLARGILNTRSVRAFVRRADMVYDALIKYAEDIEKHTEPDWVRRTIEFVDKNYSNPNMNISFIAQELDVNPVQLSRDFKEYVGTNLLEFIHTTRLREAKKLLGRGQSLDAIAAEVGYSTTRTMSRAFIKYEGITPGRLNSGASSMTAEV